VIGATTASPSGRAGGPIWHGERTTADGMASGDDFVDVYVAHDPRRVAALTLSGCDGSRAQDVAQEAFARAYPRWRRVRTGPNPVGYVYTTAFRLLRRRGGLPETSLDGHDPSTPGPEDQAVTQVGVAAALEAMPPRRRACAALCFYAGLTADEAAHALGIQPSTVRVQLHRARRALHAALGHRPS
jgi:RNA polymerase sigma factor (sigma-70 family)